MADVLTALVARSKDVAEPRAAAYASGNRLYRVQVTRPGAPAFFDRDEGTFTNPPDDVIYEGPARIYPVSGPVELEVGDERTTFSSARFTIDDYDGPNPRIDDLVLVLDNDQSQHTNIVGRVFTVNDVEAGGHFNVGWALSTTGVSPSRRS